MKKIIYISFFLFISLHLNAQITLEHTYDTASTANLLVKEQNQLMIINFEKSGERYVRINRVVKTICIYDMNHSLLKTISFASLPSNPNGLVGEVMYISENLFSADSQISFMYLYYTASSGVPALYYTKIIKEDGTVLFSDTAVAAIRVNYLQQQFPIYNTSKGTKMILSYRNRQAKVFSLPGTLSADIEGANKQLVQMQQSNISLSNAYPNPSNNTTSIDYKLPKGVSSGEMVFYNLQGEEVKRFKVDNTFTTLLISTADIAAGTYYYQLQTNGESSEGKKMVVIK